METKKKKRKQKVKEIESQESQKHTKQTNKQTTEINLQIIKDFSKMSKSTTRPKTQVKQK